MTSPALDPFARLHEVLDRARRAATPSAGPGSPTTADPTAMTLATADASGRPSARVVLLKHADAEGLVFYTNRTSRKGRELAENPHAALCFMWPSLGEQIRVEGSVVLARDDESDAYFASRARESQLGAWASLQSQPLTSRDELLQRLAEMDARFSGKPIPRPPHWGGYRLVPSRFEFWREGAARIHDRDVYERDGQGWRVTKLFP